MAKLGYAERTWRATVVSFNRTVQRPGALARVWLKTVEACITAGTCSLVTYKLL